MYSSSSSSYLRNCYTTYLSISQSPLSYHSYTTFVHFHYIVFIIVFAFIRHSSLSYAYLISLVFFISIVVFITTLSSLRPRLRHPSSLPARWCLLPVVLVVLVAVVVVSVGRGCARQRRRVTTRRLGIGYRRRATAVASGERARTHVTRTCRANAHGRRSADGVVCMYVVRGMYVCMCVCTWASATEEIPRGSPACLFLSHALSGALSANDRPATDARPAARRPARPRRTRFSHSRDSPLTLSLFRRSLALPRATPSSRAI